MPPDSRRSGSERGTGLVELVAVGALLLVMALAVTPLITAGGRGAAPPVRGQSIAAATAAVREMARELRQAYEVNAVDYVRIDVNTRVRGHVARRVAYDCGAEGEGAAGLGSCVRYEGPAGRPLPSEGTVVVHSILNGREDEGGRVFFAAGDRDPPSVGVKVDLEGDGSGLDGYRNRVVLTDRIQLKQAPPPRARPSSVGPSLAPRVEATASPSE